MTDTPEIIYLIPGEDVDGAPCMVWCDDPAPDEHCDPAEAVKYVRADKHQEIIDRQAKAALAGMDAAKHHALSAEQNARRLLAESNPEAIESERAANAQLTQELEQLRARVAAYSQKIDEMDAATRMAYLSGPNIVAQFKRLRDEAEKAGGEQ